MKFAAFALATFTALAASSAWADYPERPIQMIVPFPAGGPVDNVARSFAEVFDKKISQRVVVVNRDGASTTIGMNALAAAPNDGYTIFYGPVTALTVHLHWMKGLQFDDKTFVPVCQTFENVFMLASGPKTTFKSLEDLLNQARDRHGVMTYAHPGIASSPHLTGAELFQRAKVSLTDIPFRGENAMLQPLREGSVDAAVVTVNFVDIHKLRPFVVFSDKRYPAFPDVPTARELGYSVTPSAYGGLFMRADTPAVIVKKVESACKETMADAELQAVVKRNYQVTDYLDSARFLARLQSDSLSKAALLKTVKLEK